MAELNAKLLQLIKEIQSERIASVGDAVKKNCERIHAYVSNLEALATSRDDCTVSRNDGSGNLLSLRMSYPLFKLDSLTEWSSERDDNHGEEISISSPIRLPLSERIPPYTTWMFLDRNQRMADDQSVIGRRRIYYDQDGSEALVCSDSEDELVQLETEKHEFCEGEDRILRLAIEECGHGEVDLDLLAEFVGGTHEEIQERCNIIMDKCKLEEQDSKSSREGNYDAFCDKSLSDALDSFDNLFCRRCLVFDCRLHGCSQAIIYSNEKQPCTFDAEEGRKTCGRHCYLQLDTSNELPKISALDTPGDSNSSIKDHVQDAPGSSSEIHALADVKPSNHHSIAENEAPDRIQEHEPARNAAEGERKDNIAIQKRGSVSFGSSHKASHDSSDWKPLEKDLYLKGLEIFGRNSCFIARNLLPGLKTCKEVSSYMYGDAPSASCGSSALFQSFHEDRRESNDRDVPSKSRMCRKRGRVRKVKSSWKSAGHPSLWRRIADGNYLPCKHYTPCGCQPMCGKECPCLLTGTCCEKYCGCSINCKNRFRGCHCTKSQCKSRLCPCFAAGRECDPDVCRYCWVSCGGHELREPARRGENQCGNMKLLLRQQQRILLAKSDVAGWGAFLKNSVNKNDYLGEYTGELISHQEADKRGKIYDRANSSFLFDLNDKFVLDAYRKGDKLKFANHSSTPNCYAKVMLVVGDHRVGIYANEHIKAGQELFYDYRYGPDQAPSWARKPESSKRDGSPVPQGRTKKHQSG